MDSRLIVDQVISQFNSGHTPSACSSMQVCAYKQARLVVRDEQNHPWDRVHLDMQPLCLSGEEGSISFGPVTLEMLENPTSCRTGEVTPVRGAQASQGVSCWS